MNRRRLSFVSRITLLVLFIELAAFGLLGWFYVDHFSHFSERHLLTRSELVREMLSDDDLPISVISRRSFMTQLLEAPYLKGIVIGGSGRIIVSTETGQLGHSVDELPKAERQWLSQGNTSASFIKDNGQLTRVLPIESRSGGAQLYTVLITVSLADIQRERADIIRRGTLGFTLFVLLSTLGIVFIARRLYRGEHDLALAKQQLEQVLWSSGDGWWDWDVATGKAYFDRRWTGMLDYEQSAVPSTYDGWEKLIHPEDLDKVLDRLQRHLEGETPAYEVSFRMRCKGGEWKWIMSRGKVVERDHLDRPVRMAGTHSDITERIEAEEKIHQLAFMDPLTQLPNRRLLTDRLKTAKNISNRNHSFAALLILDLDNFKALNDTRGHDIGDRLLIEVANRIRNSIRGEDTVARFGGDEYVVVLNGLSTNAVEAAKQAVAIAEKIRHTLNQKYSLGSARFEHHNTTSVGLTLFRGHQDTAEALLKQADVALYEAKAAGRDCVRIFNPSMQESIDAHSELLSALRKGIENNEFQLFFQPQCDTRGRVVGIEALLRWNSPSRGQIAPAEFIATAEESGLILPIGHWVIETACARIKAWEGQADLEDLQIAINVSAKQFRQQDFVDSVCQSLEHSGANPSRLKIELTESVVLDNIAEVGDKMRSLKKLGVTFSLDDFGMGYSSLYYLKQLPIDQLKIDQSFVRDILGDPNDAAIVRAILSMSSSLEIQAIAEGVETTPQLQFLTRNGCSHFQGYLFGKPMAPDDFETWFRNHGQADLRTLGVS